MSHFDDCMSALGSELGIAVDHEPSHAVLELDGLLYDLYYDEERETVMALAMVADLGDSPAPLAQAAIYKRLLKAQFCFAGTGNLSFALSNDDKFIALQGLWNLRVLSEREFVDLFEGLVQATRLWSKRLQHAAEDTAEASASSPEDFGSFDMLRV